MLNAIDENNNYMGNLYKRILVHIFNKVVRIRGRNNKIVGIARRNVLIRGNNNIIECHSLAIGEGVKIIMNGDNHHLHIEDNVTFKKGVCWFEDTGNKIIIRRNTTIEDAHLSACEKETSIVVGKDCMLSSDIRIATTDSHSIIDKNSKKRINHAKSIKIGNHVWIGTRVTINKGVIIGDNSVVASNSLVTKNVCGSSVFGGIPAVMLRNNIDWVRERI